VSLLLLVGGSGMGLGATRVYPPSSCRTSGDAVRPSAWSWRKMNEPFLRTASTICHEGGGEKCGGGKVVGKECANMSMHP
jgi:hypothetical protein